MKEVESECNVLVSLGSNLKTSVPIYLKNNFNLLRALNRYVIPLDIEGYVKLLNFTLNDEEYSIIKRWYNTININSNCKITFIAPDVDESTIYTITATLEEYDGDIATITVLDIDVDEPKSFVYGVVSSGSVLLKDVKITISTSDQSRVTYTDEEGKYVISIPPGIYSVEASIQGYETNIKSNMEAAENTAIEVDFNLVESTEPAEEEGGMAEYIVKDQMKDGNVGAEIDVAKRHVTYYSDIEVAIEQAQLLTDGNVKFTIAGEGEGTLVVIYISGVEYPKDVFLKYDNVEIERTSDVLSFLDSQNTDESWVMLSTEVVGEFVVLLNIPEFSEHTITISSLVETAVSITAVILYIAISVIALFLFFSPMLANLLHIQRRSRKKR